ncbi:MAG: hypothetical protein QG653_18 [Patescibacteria group bacterium]|nr:hypothetical protein [Patescibacteria group bacterium]
MQFLIDVILILSYGVALLFLIAWAWRFWVFYLHRKFIDDFSKSCILLEIRLPREIFKSPIATETALDALLQGGGVGTWHHRFWKGNLPSWFSLEIASLEGVIHFYVYTHKKFRQIIEANFYAQYPGIEIVEADDYTKRIRYNHLDKNSIAKAWGASYSTTQKWPVKDLETGEVLQKGGKDYEMPAQFYPIKTYVDYGLDKDPKEEFKIDPITPLLEFMGGIGKDEYVWYQILLQDEGAFNGKKFPKMFLNEVKKKAMDIKEMAKWYKSQMMITGTKEKGSKAYDEYGNVKTIKQGDQVVEVTYQETKAIKRGLLELTKEEQQEIEAINEKLSKPLARTIIRLFYITKKEKFNPNYIQNIVNIMKPYKGVNSFAPSPTDPYDFPWQTMGGKRVDWRTEELFNAMVERSGFHPFIPPKDNDKAMDSLDWWEDGFFYVYPTRYRIMFRTVYEVLVHPFAIVKPKEVTILNLEEIATLWHLPGAVATTPTLPRIDSTKGVAPVNLPV